GVIHLVKLWVCPAENGGMRSRGERNLRKGVRKDNRFAGQRVEIWSEAVLRSEKSHAVSASGIQCNNDDVGHGGGCERVTTPEEEQQHQPADHVIRPSLHPGRMSYLAASVHRLDSYAGYHHLTTSESSKPPVFHSCR